MRLEALHKAVRNGDAEAAASETEAAMDAGASADDMLHQACVPAVDSVVEPDIMKEFMVPHHKQVSDLAKGKGIKTILVDTDGNCERLIPLLFEGGVSGLYPVEVSAGVDLVKARRKYPQLQVTGGVPRSDIALGRKRIVEFLADENFLLGKGGYIPIGDHLIPPDVPWQEFSYYREKLCCQIDRHEKK